MECKKCGTALTINSKFCTECGTPVPKQEEKKVQEKKEFPPILTINQAAEFLSVSRCQIYKLIDFEGLPWFPLGPGSRKRFLTDELILWSKNRQIVKQAV